MRRLKRVKELKNWRETVRKIARAAREELGEVRVYVFGSAVRGELIASSDVDVLICSPTMPEDEAELWNLKKRIMRRAGLNMRSPFQLHLVNEEGEKFYLEVLRVEAIEVE